MPFRELRMRACRLYPYKGNPVPSFALVRGVVLACLCFLLLGLSQPILADDQPAEEIEKHNRIEDIFPFSEGVLLADRPLPDKVFERRRYTLQIFMVIHKRGDLNTIYATASGSATAYPTNKPGTIVSSAHIIQQPMFQIAKTTENSPLQSKDTNSKVTGQNSIVSIIGGDEEEFRKFTYAELRQKLEDLNCEFSLFGRAYSGIRFTELVPLKILAITEPENSTDIVVLQLVNVAAITQKAIELAEPAEKINPYRAFITPIIVAPPAKTGETVYITGFGVLQPFVEEVQIGARLKNTQYAPGPYTGLTNPYSIRGTPVPGFSGGPVLNREGQMIGVIKGGDGKFSLVISIDDIEKVIKKAKLDK